MSFTSKIDLPPVQQSIYFDIEYDQQSNTVWSIAIKLDYYERVFFASQMEDEDMIINQFILFLEQHPYYPLVCYSCTYFDCRILKNKWDEFPRLEAAMLNRAWIDLGTLLRKYYTPKTDLKLKTLAREYGFPLREYSDGRLINHLYVTACNKLGKVPEELERKLVAYNLDDVRILAFIRNRFGENVRDTPQYVGEVDYGTLKHIRSVKYADEECRIVLDTDLLEPIIYEIMKLGIPFPNSMERQTVVWSSKLGREMIVRLFATMTPIQIIPNQKKFGR